ncbi:MAG: hypothetical protein HYR91_15220 [Flavobacteriia bacterium]|nr:hypothetical protein [Flavobacteriia bacterium]
MYPHEIANKKILISPLNWGFGHVSRCLPLIDQLLKQENSIFIACNKEQKKIISNYFNSHKLIYIEHQGYPFEFNKKGNFIYDVLKRSYKLYKRFVSEKKEVNHLTTQFQIDIIISDHRYGFFSKKITSIFITHQINLPLTGLFKFMDTVHKKMIRNFNIVWVLDDKKSTYAGKLSLNSTFKNCFYIGIKSRFSFYLPLEKTIEQVVIISGPEPHAQLFFESELIKASKIQGVTYFISPKKYKYNDNNKNIIIESSDNWITKDKLILKSKKIISRSGYSTIMDIATLKIDCELIPTKGQKEQEYLKIRHSKKYCK